MTRRLEPDRSTRSAGWVFAVAIALAAVNLRPAVASVGPVLDDIRADLGLSGASASLLTVLPLLCFGAGALVAPGLARRFGSEAVLVGALAMITVGVVVRVGPDPFTLFAGTVLAGAAIALANVLIPAMIKRSYPSGAGLVMGLYISVTVGGAAVAAGVTVPLTELLGRQWRGGLGVWAVPAAVAFVVWLVLASSRRRHSLPDDRTSEVPASLVRDPVAWQVTTFFGLQGLIFYALLSWMPSMYRSYGLDPETAGQVLSLLIILGVPTALVLPSLLTRSSRQSGWALGVVTFTAAGTVGLLFAPAAPYLWATVLGLGLGASFPLALTLIVMRSPTAGDAAQLSAMSQSVGYGMAALGPFLFGLLHDLSGGWTLPVILLLILMVPQAVMGAAAGRPVYVRGRAARRPV